MEQLLREILNELFKQTRMHEESVRRLLPIHAANDKKVMFEEHMHQAQRDFDEIWEKHLST